jgi:hypothetical protein
MKQNEPQATPDPQISAGKEAGDRMPREMVHVPLLHKILGNQTLDTQVRAQRGVLRKHRKVIPPMYKIKLKESNPSLDTQVRVLHTTT